MAVRWGQLSGVQIFASDTAGNDPRYGLLHNVTINSEDDTPVTGPRWGELYRLVLFAIYHEVEPFLDVTANSLESVQLTAGLTDGTLADRWEWRQISGPTAVMSIAGEICTVEAPPTVEGATVVIGCIGVKQGGDSPENEANIIVKPHQRWRKTALGWTPFQGAPQ